MFDPEEEVHRVLTQAWVESDPVEIILRRPMWQDDGAGGRIPSGYNPIVPQIFRMDAHSAQQTRMITTPDGRTVPASFRIVSETDADIQVGDIFTLFGVEFRIIHVPPRNTFGRRYAEVAHG